MLMDADKTEPDGNVYRQGLSAPFKLKVFAKLIKSPLYLGSGSLLRSILFRCSQGRKESPAVTNGLKNGLQHFMLETLISAES